MPLSRWSLVLLVLALASPFGTAHAQRAGAAATAVTPDPGDPRASVPPVRYESAFARYRPNTEVEVRPWRALNDTVGRVGGWRVYGREAIEPSAAETTPPARRAADGAPASHDHGHRPQGAR